MQRWRAGVLALALAGTALSGCQQVNPPTAGTTEATSSTAAKPSDTAQSSSIFTSRTSSASSDDASSQEPPTRAATAAARCPARLQAAARSEIPLPPVNGISSRLVPQTPARAALLCSYLGTNMDPIADQRLTTSRTLTSDLTALVRDLRWLPPRIDGQSVYCTDVGGAQTNYLLALMLTDGTTAWVAAAQDPNGCVPASNGTFTALANIGPELATTMKTGRWPGRRPLPGACSGGSRYGQQTQLVPEGAVSMDICRSAGGEMQSLAHLTNGFTTVIDALNAQPHHPLDQLLLALHDRSHVQPVVPLPQRSFR